MRLLAIPVLLISTLPIVTSKHSHLTLEKIHDEIAQVHRRANRYLLETEARDVTPDWILERNNTLMELGDTYGAMEISEALDLDGQYQLVELWKEEMESGFSDAIRKQVVIGFGELERCQSLRDKILKVETSKIRAKMDVVKAALDAIDPANLEDNLKRIDNSIKQINSIIKAFNSRYPKSTPWFFYTRQQKFQIWEKFLLITDEVDQINKCCKTVLSMFQRARRLSTEGEDKFPFPKAVKVAYSVYIKKYLKDWPELVPTMKHASKEMKRLMRLKTESENSPIKEFLVNVEKDFGHLKNYKISENVFNRYQEIPSLHPLLEKIRSLTSYIKKAEWRVGQLSKSWKPFEEHFRGLHFPDDVSVEKFEGVGKCLKNYKYSMEDPNLALKTFSESSARIPSNADFLDRDMKYFRALEGSKHVQAISKYNDEKLDGKVHEHLEYLQDEMWYLMRFLELSKSRYGSLSGDLMNTVNRIKGIFNYDVFRTTMDALDAVVHAVSCYGNLSVTKADIENLLDSTKDMWNFDPQGLESTVHAVRMFKEAYKRAKEVSEWKSEDHNSSSPDDRFVLEKNGVQKITLVLEGLESIRQVRKMWKELKTLEILNPDWDLFSSSLSSFIEELSPSDSSFAFFTNTSFPPNFPIDPLRKYIKEDYEGSYRGDILELLEKVQLLEVQYPTADMIEDLKEAMKEMKEWEAGKSEQPVAEYPKIHVTILREVEKLGDKS